MSKDELGLENAQYQKCLVDGNGDNDVPVEHAERTTFSAQLTNNNYCEDLNIELDFIF
jgi:hypothetical protein